MGDNLENDKVAEDVKALENFVLDIESLNDLYKWGNKVNFFEISGMARAEIRHSNVLAWLFDANQNHGLGDIVIKKFIQKILRSNGISGDDLFKFSCEKRVAKHRHFT